MTAAPLVEFEIDSVWTNVTTYVLGEPGTHSIHIGRGRAGASDRPRSAECNFTLKNPTDRRFSGDVPGTLYYRKFGRGTRVRVAVGSDRRFLGEIAALRQKSDDAGSELPLIVVRATGILHRLDQGAKPLRSAAYRMITGAGPIAYWPMEDDSEATQIASAIPGQLDGTFIPDGLAFGADSDVAGSEPLLQMDQAEYFRYYLMPYTEPSPQGWCVVWRMKIPSEPAASTPLMGIETPAGDVYTWRADLVNGTPTQIRMLGLDKFNADQIAEDSDFTIGTAEPYGVDVAFAMRVVQNGADIDWDLAYATADGVSTMSGTLANSTLGPIATIGRGINSGPDSVTAGHVAAFADSTAVDDLVAFASGHSQEAAGERIQRLCAEAGVSVTVTGDASLTTLMGPQQTDTLFNLLFAAMEADGGILYEPRDAFGLAYRTRLSLYNQVPALELTYAAPAAHLSAALELTGDDDKLANDVTVSRVGGSSARYMVPDGDFWHFTTEDPPDGVGTREATASLNLYEDGQLAAHAAWRAHLNSWREGRYVRVPVELGRDVFEDDATLTAAAIATDIGDLITIDDQPDWLPPDPIELLAQGSTEQITKFTHEIVWNTTPGRAWEVAQVDTGGSTLVVAVDSDDTSLKLATSLGPEWSTTEEPYHIQIAGEAMTVTAMATDTPAYIAAGAVAHGNNTAVTPGLPAGITPDVGQSLFIWAAIRNSGTGTPDDEAGWTTLVSFGNTKLYHRYYVTGDTAPEITFTGGVAGADTSARMFAFSGLSKELAGSTVGRYGSSTPGAATQLNASAQNIDWPLLYVNRDGSVVLILLWKQDDWTNTFTPAGMDAEMFDNTTTTGNDQGIEGSYDIQTTATDIAAGTATVSGGAAAISRAVVVALRPLQTATVTRSVNGVTGAIAAGEAVHGWRMGLNAL